MEINSENAGNLASEVVGSHKKRGCLKQIASFCGEYRSRTDDPLLAKQVLQPTELIPRVSERKHQQRKEKVKFADEPEKLAFQRRIKNLQEVKPPLFFAPSFAEREGKHRTAE